MKIFVFLLLIVLFPTIWCGNSAYAVSAFPNWVRVMTTNGKTAVICMKGDECQKYAITEDGYTLINDSSGWWYATVTNAGKVEISNFRLMAEEDETLELKRFKANCSKGIVPERHSSSLTNRIMEPNKVNRNGPIVGKRRALVILMQYKDLPFIKTKNEFEDLFNTLGYKQDGAIGSVRDYYYFASQGQLDYISDIYGPYISKNPMRYYGGNSLIGGSDKNPQELCIEAIKSLPSNIDFSVYDNDGDGLVDNVHIIYAGYGEEAGALSDAIWAHEYPHRISLRNEVGYSFAGYSCSPELRGNSGSKISNIGVICHELGHALGAMDYYDTNYETGGEYDGTGKWDIMASGSWNDNGRSPANFNPFVRSAIFGWNQQKTLKPNEKISIPRNETDNVEKTVIYKVETGYDGDYFLLENRQQYMFDGAIPGAGLMIYHVHPNIEKYQTTNTVNATHPQGLYPVCASYSEPERRKYGNINSSECPFPGSRNVRSFSADTSPAAVAWNGSAAKVALSNITMNTDGSITFSTGEETSVDSEIPDTPVEMNIIYKESFEANVGERITSNILMGRETWRSFKKGDFVTNAEYLPNATDGNGILMLYSSKSNIMSESEATGSEISVEPGHNYSISFDVYSEGTSTQLTPYFNLLIEDEYGEYNVYTLNKSTRKWSKVEIPIVFAGSQFKYKLYGRILTGGIFVDNIRLYKENTLTSLKPCTNTSDKEEDTYLYRLDGSYIGRFEDCIKQLTYGLYIIKKGQYVYKYIYK